MKNQVKLLLLATSFLAVIVAYAAPNDTLKQKRPKQFLSVDLGTTSSMMHGTETDLQLGAPGAQVNAKSGIQLGFSFKTEFADFIYVKTGLSYLEKKSYITGSYAVNNNNVETGFINIPLVVGLQLVSGKDSKKIKLAVECGGSISKVSSKKDNLESGLYPGQAIQRPDIIPSFVVGANLEVFFTEKIGGFLNYRFSKDLNYYFSRRYTWYDYNQNKNVYQDYDVWLNCTAISFGLIFRAGH